MASKSHSVKKAGRRKPQGTYNSATKLLVAKVGRNLYQLPDDDALRNMLTAPGLEQLTYAEIYCTARGAEWLQVSKMLKQIKRGVERGVPLKLRSHKG